MNIVWTPQESILKDYNKRIRANNLVHLKEIKKLLNTIFGEEHNQIAELDISKGRINTMSLERCISWLNNSLNEPHYDITVHFPLINISNTAGLSHEIKDLYVRFKLKGDLKLINNIDGESGYFLQGMKTTFTKEEWDATYTHSHLPGKCTYFQRFCTGTGPINMQAVQLASNFSTVGFNMFLHSINLYVKHESTEGVPYRYISNITKPNGEVGPLNSISEVFPDMFLRLRPLIIENYKLLGFTVDKRGITVKPSDEFSIKVAESIDELKTIDSTIFHDYANYPLTAQRLTDGRYTIPIVQRPVDISNRPLLNFKGEDKILNIIYDTTIRVDDTKYTHPDILGFICKQLGKDLTKAAFNQQAA